MDSKNIQNNNPDDDSSDTASSSTSSTSSTVINPINTLFPKIYSSTTTGSTNKKQITSIRSNPNKLRLRKNIEDILGENTTEFLDNITDIMWDRIYLNKKSVTPYEEFITYIEKRLL